MADDSCDKNLEINKIKLKLDSFYKLKGELITKVEIYQENLKQINMQIMQTIHENDNSQKR